MGFRIVPESARWLVSQKRYEEADKILQKAARFNNVELPADWHEHLDTDVSESLPALQWQNNLTLQCSWPPGPRGGFAARAAKMKLGAPPPDHPLELRPRPRRLGRKNVAGGSDPRPQLGLRSRPRWGSATNPVEQGVWGREAPAGSGAEPSYILAAEPPRSLGRSPHRRGPLAPL